LVRDISGTVVVDAVVVGVAPSVVVVIDEVVEVDVDDVDSDVDVDVTTTEGTASEAARVVDVTVCVG